MALLVHILCAWGRVADPDPDPVEQNRIRPILVDLQPERSTVTFFFLITVLKSRDIYSQFFCRGGGKFSNLNCHKLGSGSGLKK